MTERPRARTYSRARLGGGNTLRAVTRTKRAAASRSTGKAPGKAPGPANWRAHRRKATQAAVAAIEAAQAREQEAA